MTDLSRRGRRSREKGKRGEREAAALLRRFGFAAQRAQQYQGRAGVFDLSCPELEALGLPVEVKAVKRPVLGVWIETLAEKGIDSFLLLWKRERDGWYAVLPAEKLLELLQNKKP